VAQRHDAASFFSEDLSTRSAPVIRCPFMLRSLFTILGLALLPVGFSGCGTFTGSGLFGPEEIKVRTTAYTHTEADHLKYGRKNALGTPLRHGKIKSAASDWSKYPVGTKFRIKETGEVFEIDDYGSALVGTDTIDLYKTSKHQMRHWGVREVEIEVLEWGCFDESHTILEPRIHHRHVKKMFEALTPKLSNNSFFRIQSES